MNGEKETQVDPVEQQINSMMGAVGNEIMDFTQKSAGAKEDETIQKIHMVTLSRCIIYLAKQIDKLADSIK